MNIRALVLLIAAGSLVSLTGCTVYPEKRPPTVATTTSAEQHERLYWSAVQKDDWQQVVALQGPSVLFTTRSGEHVTGEQWIAGLKQNPPAEYLIGAVELRPQGADMMVSYFVSTTEKSRATETKSTTPTDMAVVSVWQQVGSNLILVAHSETLRTSPTK